MAQLGEVFNGDDYPEILSALDELRQHQQWVCWALVTRPGAAKPTKPPMSPHTGRGASHAKPSDWGTYEQAKSMAERRKFAGVGFVLTEDDGYTGVDLDRCRDPETGKLDQWADDIVALNETYWELSPSGTGLRAFVRGKIEKTVKCDTARVEVYRSLRYLTYTGEHIEGTPEDIRPAPLTLEWLMERVAQFAPKVEAPEPLKNNVVALRSSSTHKDAGERAYAQTALDGNAAELASLGEGGRNHALNAKAFRMGRMVAAGWIEKSTVEAALTDACRANGLFKDDGPKGVRASLASGLRGGMAKPCADLDDARGDELLAEGNRIAERLIAMQEGVSYDAETGEIVEDNLPAVIAPKIGIPAHLARPAGLMGEIIDWVYDTALSPSYETAIGVAISIMGTAMSRYWCGPTFSATHQYVVVLGATGVGKNHSLACCDKLMRSIGMKGSIGSKFMSESAIYVRLAQTPILLCKIDEIGTWLASIHSRRASSHEKGITAVLRTAWGTSFDWIRSGDGAARGMTEIYAPALSIYSVATPKEFWDAFGGGGSVDNGFLNRFMMFSIDSRPADVEPRLSFRDPVPPSIVNGLEAIKSGHAFRGAGDKDMLWTSQCLEPNIDDPFNGVAIPWASPEVHSAFRAFRAETLAFEDAGEKKAPFFIRCPEAAIRLAASCAAGRNPRSPRVSMEDWLWGRGISEWSAGVMFSGASMHMSDSDHQAGCQKIIRIIDKRGGKCREREIARGLDNSLKDKDWADMLASLVKSGKVRETIKKPEGGGRPSKSYELLA